jgi:hypothetical protein
MIAKRAFHGYSRTVVGGTLEVNFISFFSAFCLHPSTVLLTFDRTYPR